MDSQRHYGKINRTNFWATKPYQDIVYLKQLLSSDVEVNPTHVILFCILGLSKAYNKKVCPAKVISVSELQSKKSRYKVRTLRWFFLLRDTKGALCLHCALCRFLSSFRRDILLLISRDKIIIGIEK